jgi:transposase
MTHDYKRHGTTTLFAAIDLLEGKVIGQCMKRHRHQEFIRFLNVIDARVPKKLAVHVIVDNYAAHKHPKVLDGSYAIPDLCSISPRPRHPGSTQSRACSRFCPSGA